MINDTIRVSMSQSLARLNSRLLYLVEQMRTETGREPGADPFRGLYITPMDVIRFLTAQAWQTPSAPGPLADEGWFAGLSRRYMLSQFERDVLLVAIAPEIDLAYEQTYAYLHDDVSRKRPSLDLIFKIVCESPAERIDVRAELVHGILLRKKLIRVVGEDNTPLLRREALVDSRVLAFLLGDSNLDPRLHPFASLQVPGSQHRGPGAGLLAIAESSENSPRPVAIYLQGANEATKRLQAANLAGALGKVVIVAEAGRASRLRPQGFEDWLQYVATEAMLQNAVVYYTGLDVLADETFRDALSRHIADSASLTVLSGTQEWKRYGLTVRGIVTVGCETPEWRERRTLWSIALAQQAIAAPAESMDMLAECFRFGPDEIEDSAETAARLAMIRGQRPDVAHVFEAARSHSGRDMGNLARKVAAVHSWNDLVLPHETIEQLREICRRITLRHRVHEQWGFGRRLASGKGVSALFHGHSGTGKTMAAEVIARELQTDLYKIDLAGVVSKYIGETEKNLDRIFSAAENANVILFFDEADALFGKRSEVRDSHDRYANIEISYLLQKMEQYEGLSILATNLRQNLDEAFLRRLAFSVHFPFPDEASRFRIWTGIWPRQMPIADIDNGCLASRFLLSGGNIRNAAVAAAFLAARDNGRVTMSHVMTAVRDEFLKMGKTLTPFELALPDECLMGAMA